MAGAGLSSVDELIGFIELSQGNFDISGFPFTGGGQKIRTRLTLGTKRRDYEISFTEPWFLNRKLSFGVSAFQHDSRFLSDDFDQRNTGGSVSLGRPIPGTTYWRSTLQYALENVEVRNVAAEVASHGVQVNAVGTNYMNFPQYWDAVGGETPERRAALEKQVPLGRMGELDEHRVRRCRPPGDRRRGVRRRSVGRATRSGCRPLPSRRPREAR